MRILLILIICGLSVSKIGKYEQIKHATNDSPKQLFWRDDIRKYQLYPYFASEEIKNYVDKCEDENNKRIMAATAIGFGALAIFAPFLAPVFAAKGLFGAAAVSNGLATLGGGAIAVGGAGMLGGTIVLATAGGFSGSVIGVAMRDNGCYQSAIKQMPLYYDDYIYYNNGNIMYVGEFKKNLFHGEGTFRDLRGKIIYKGIFENGMPSPQRAESVKIE